MTPKGKRTYFLYYRTKDHQQRRPAIGTHGPLKPEAAREIAKGWLAEVAKGNDPSQQRSAMDRTAPAMRQLCARYLSEHAETRKKASSIRHDRRTIDVHILPALGAKKVASISRAEVAALHHSLRSTPYEANRTLALLSKMFSLAAALGTSRRRHQSSQEHRPLPRIEAGKVSVRARACVLVAGAEF